MTINRKFATLGAIIFLIPYLGIPDSWKSVLIGLLGVAVVFTAIDFGKPKKKSGRRKTDKLKTNETFSENNFIEKHAPIKLQERKLTSNSEIPDENSGI